MSRSALKGLQAAAGAAGGGDPVYVDDVFSTFVYEGNGNGKRIQNNIKLADGAENNTFLQITGDGSISDVSPFGHTLTVSSTATTSTSVKKFGSASLDLSYDASTYPTVSAPLDTAPRADEDFTVEGWIYHSDAAGSHRCIYSSGVSLQIYLHSRNVIAYCSTSPTGSSYFVNGIGGGANSVSNNTWAHFAFVRHGNTFTVYVNGVGGTATTSTSPVGSAARSLIGGYTTSSYGFTAGGGNGYIDDFRITRGRAVYTANFTPPSSAHSLDTQVTGEGGLVWLKRRSSTKGYHLYDTARGVTKMLSSDGADAEDTKSDGLIAFNSDGFSLGSESQINGDTSTNVGWTFRKQPGFCDIVTYTGNGGSNRAISHNLDSKPGLIIIKATSMSAGWMVGAGFTSTQYYRLALETSGGASGGGLANYNNYLSAEPTTTTFSVGNEGLGNANGQTYVAYLFANDDQRFGENSDEAIIKYGSYTGNGSSTGPSINLGFEPQWLLIKSTGSNSGVWTMLDTMRGLVVGGNDQWLAADDTFQEQSFAFLDVTPTGFDIKTSGYYVNANNVDYIYMAIRRPHKPASELAATDLLGLDKPTSGNKITPGFPADFGFAKNTTGAGAWYVGSRLTSTNYHNFNTNNAENNASGYSWDSMTQFFNGYTWADYMSYGFRRAPGFMDVVCYTGVLSSTAVKHNLGVVPEMVWRKRRDSSSPWYVWASVLSGAGTAQANGNFYNSDTSGDGSGFSNGQYYAGDTQFNNITPATATEFTQGVANVSTATYVTYLFASVTGISKIGTYTGTGNDLNVDCGFSAGARFVLIKRSDASGGWYVWDSVRGIVSGNDPYSLFNSQAVDVTNTDYIDPLSSGFTVTSSAPDEINASGGTYLFYAIA